MERSLLLGMILAIFLGITMGCGDSGPTKVEKNPVNTRQEETQKEKQKNNFMKP